MQTENQKVARLWQKGAAVFLLEPETTQFDLRFKLFRTWVRVHPMFWLLSAALGWGWMREGIGWLLLWVGCVFLSILVHEFGHILAGQAFGRPGYIVLYSFGGLAIGDFQVPRRWQRIVISLSGPAAGFVLLGVVWFIKNHLLTQVDQQFWKQRPTLALGVFTGYLMLWWINLVWGIVNLLPIWPLDGGHVSREIFSALFPGNGLRLSLGLSFVLAGLGALYILLTLYNPDLPHFGLGSGINALFLGLLALQSFQLLQHVERDRRHRDDGWERDPDIWGR
jgi:Zn-dependent protease